MGVAGRYILTPGVFREIASQPRGVGGEIQLTDGIASLLRREKVFTPTATKASATTAAARKAGSRRTSSWRWQHPQVGAGFRDFLRGMKL
jgi:UTP--glucose-1-phosphate uridylyltransferase